MEKEEWMDKVVESSGKQIEDADSFLIIFTDNYKKSPECALQLGIAILMDKPIGLVVKKGTEVPDVLKRIAFQIEYFSDYKDVFDLAKKLTEAIKAEVLARKCLKN